MDYIKDCLNWDNWIYFYKNEYDNYDAKATGQIYIVHKNLKLSSFIQDINGVLYSDC